ncbi:uncharacterized protein LOC129399439 isoform X2 [Sorex araneus]|nr:uncharacterized protein LOC129399439 isoform X2 [Sorex araneus]
MHTPSPENNRKLIRATRPAADAPFLETQHSEKTGEKRKKKRHPTAQHKSLFLPEDRNERQKNNTCLPEKAPGKKKKKKGKKKKKKGRKARPGRDELWAQLSANNNTPRSSAPAVLPASGRRTDRRADRPPSPPPPLVFVTSLAAW